MTNLHEFPRLPSSGSPASTAYVMVYSAVAVDHNPELAGSDGLVAAAPDADSADDRRTAAGSQTVGSRNTRPYATGMFGVGVRRQRIAGAGDLLVPGRDPSARPVFGTGTRSWRERGWWTLGLSGRQRSWGFGAQLREMWNRALPGHACRFCSGWEASDCCRKMLLLEVGPVLYGCAGSAALPVELGLVDWDRRYLLR